MFDFRHDWHSANIVAALQKKDTTLSDISHEFGLNSQILANTLIRSYPKGEWIIANLIGIHPSEIWPSRYFDSNYTLINRNVNYELYNLIKK